MCFALRYVYVEVMAKVQIIFLLPNKNETFYNWIKLKDYSVDSYLKGIEVVYYEYRVLFSMIGIFCSV